MYNDVTPPKSPVWPPHTPHARQAEPTGPTHQSAPPRQAFKPKKRESWRNVLTTAAVLLLAPLFALLLTTYVFQTYQVDGPSMENTLQPNDRLIVWKVPRTWARITGSTYVPARGDIIVFTEQRLSQYGQPPSKQLIKRVAGLPGERVTVEDGVLTVYNQSQPDGFQPDADIAADMIPGGTLETAEFIVPEGHVFVAGDNRSNSLDSRTFGPIPLENVIGKLAFRVLPINSAQRF